MDDEEEKAKALLAEFLGVASTFPGYIDYLSDPEIISLACSVGSMTRALARSSTGRGVSTKKAVKSEIKVTGIHFRRQ